MKKRQSFLYATFSKLFFFYLLENVFFFPYGSFFFRLMYMISNLPPPPFHIKLMCLSFILNYKWITIHVNKNYSSCCRRTIYQQYCYQLYYSYLFCCFVEMKKNTLVEPFFNCLFTFTMECGAYSNNAMSSRSSFTK